jgi:hypothetical protein
MIPPSLIRRRAPAMKKAIPHEVGMAFTWHNLFYEGLSGNF